MEEKQKKLETELQLLALTRSKTAATVGKGNVEKILRHKETLRKIVKAVEDIKVDIEKAQLEAGESIDDVEKWGTTIEQHVDEADVEISDLTRNLEDAAARAEDFKREKQETLLARQREQELEFEKLNLEQKAKVQLAEQAAAVKSATKTSVKMPKLIITKYDGTYEKWLSFWNKFEAEIDSSDLPAVTKFSHLKELLESNVCESIDGLPFNSEGYERAKNILTSNYGKTSEIVRAYIDNLNALPVITGSQPSRIHKFCQTLNYNVQSLETLGKLSSCLSMVRGILDKLPGIKAELVSGKVGWQDWGFSELMGALEEWKAIHPLELAEKVSGKPPAPPPPRPPRHRSFYSQEREPATRHACVYCDCVTHRTWECDKVTSLAERRRILQSKRLCFNCTGPQHNASHCPSRASCVHCKQKHHSSICDRKERAGQPRNDAGVALTATQDGEKVCHPIVLVNVNGVTCRALLDTGATVSYASGYLLDRLKLRPTRKLTRRVQTIVGVITKQNEIFSVQASDTQGKYTIPLSVTRVERAELLSVENPNYAAMISKYPHLKGVYMEDSDSKKLLPVHVILGASDYARIKTRESQRTGAVGEPVAEYTRFGWTIMSPGTETDLDSMFLAQTASTDYEELYRMDVLGLEDTTNGDQGVVYAEFCEQLRRSPEGWYETRLPWKGDHPPLPTNESGSLKRLGSLVQRLMKTSQLDEYDAIIQDQLREGIVELADKPASGKEFYIPHKAVVRESAESTKMRVVYDASAKAHTSAPSLNDCLDVGPPLQNKLWKVLVRGRFHPVALADDIRKAFLQVRIHPQDRDALRFHWLEAKDPQRIQTYRFTRALFGLGPSPFLLGGVIQQHLNSCREEHPKCVEEIERELYVDDLLTGGPTTEEVKHKKATTTEIFGQATFHLHKWHSNVKELELDDIPENNAKELEPAEVTEHEDDLSYAKQPLGVQSRQCGLLGLKWDKLSDEIGVVFPEKTAQPTKRGILGKVAKIYDPLGLAAPITLQGKLLYREACDEKRAWDAPLSTGLVQQWEKWENSLPHQITCPRSLTGAQESIENIELHAFGDASGKGVAAAVYAVVKQTTSVNQGLVTAKARLAKQGLTIPRRELVSGHMAVNLLSNVQDALQGFPVNSLHCWLDSSVALHWIRGDGDFKQFVANRVRKIREHGDITWRHVPTKDNPADLASRGGLVPEEKQPWWKGPAWLSDPGTWPPDLVTVPTVESNAEVKAIKELFALAVEKEDELDDLLSKLTYWRTLRVCAWMMRFARNARTSKANRKRGPLTTEEIEKQKLFWLLRVQTRGAENIEKDRLQLNLQRNQDGVLECRGRLQGFYPLYIPDSTTFAEKFVQQAHLATLHGGVSLTMSKVREQHWIPWLRRLVKRVIKQCYGCKRFQAVALAAPPPGLLPLERTECSGPFEVVGVDFAGPIKYRKSSRAESKAYLILYACSLTRALYLQVLPNLETTTFLGSLKCLIARRGRPSKIFSDNGRTFVGAAKWLNEISRDERLQAYLAEEQITWRFNLSRAPWWGGQFERLVGVFKRAFFKTIGGGMLSWSELSEVVLEIETQLNRRPLSYVEDDVQLPLLTPASFLFQRSNRLPDREPWREENVDLRRRAKYLKACKDALWKRWSQEYLTTLRERHNLSNHGKPRPLKIGDVVVIRSDETNRGKWPLGVVEQLFPGRDGVVRAVKLRAGKTFLERPIQHLYPLELSCDNLRCAAVPTQLNADAPVFRPRRDAAVAAQLRVRDTVQDAEL